jgi:hypothetical protein
MPDSNHLLTPIDTRHLKPIKQTTKHAIVELASDGQLWLDFAGDSSRMAISKDGQEVGALDGSLPV